MAREAREALSHLGEAQLRAGVGVLRSAILRGAAMRGVRWRCVARCGGVGADGMRSDVVAPRGGALSSVGELKVDDSHPSLPFPFPPHQLHSNPHSTWPVPSHPTLPPPLYHHPTTLPPPPHHRHYTCIHPTPNPTPPQPTLHHPTPPRSHRVSGELEADNAQLARENKLLRMRVAELRHRRK